MENLICKGVSKRYKDKEVLKNVDLVLEPGKIYGMIGRNGAGKTTLLSMMSAQNPVTSGQILLGETPVWENTRALSQICFSRELSAGSSVGALKICNYLRTASIYYPYWDQAMADRLVAFFQLDKKKQIAKLSKGMMSMITIIVALASKAPYTFLDEPVAGLDIVARQDFYRLLLEEYGQSNRTFVLSTHIIEEASDIFEEVIMIDQQKILLKENTQHLLERALHVSGRTEAVDAAVAGMRTYHEEQIGRSKGVTVLLTAGQHVAAGPELTVQPVTLQNLFAAVCGKEMRLYE